MKTPLILLITLSPTLALADWKTDIGWYQLQEWATLNGVTFNDTSALTIGMGEADTNSSPTAFAYFPDTTSTQLSDETILDISATSTASSSHATSVASYFFGNSSSISPTANLVNVYEANDFLSKIGTLNSSLWQERVMNHSWTGSVGGAASTTTISARLDAITQNSGTLFLVGANNSSTSSLPELLCHAYNNISVGRTDGNHSHGTIPSGYEGAGRQKPEIVNNFTTTSYATAATSSVAAFLRAQNTSVAPVVLKSILLAGATKEEFSDWDNTSTRPIDDIYGAGEVNVLNSYRILHAGEQSSGPINNYGWDTFTPSGRNRFPQSYTFTIPSDTSKATLCANLSWNRPSSGSSYGTLANLSLTLTNSSGATVASSDSPVDNLEHLWLTSLAPGTYTLTVNSNSSATYALAWRIDTTQANTTPTSFSKGSSSNSLSFSNLIPNHDYILQRTSNLSSWSDVSTLTTDNSGNLSTSDTNTSLGEKVFYRLRYYTP